MQVKTKNSPVPRAVVEAFYRALAERDVGTLASYLDDDVVWTISGPVDTLPFCGQRAGKDNVVKLLVQDSPAFLSDRRFVPNTMLVDGNNAAVLARLTATKREDGHASAIASRTSSSSMKRRSSNTCRSSTASTQSSRCSDTISMPMTGIALKVTSSPSE